MPLPLSLKVKPGWSGATPQESISTLRLTTETGGIITPSMIQHPFSCPESLPYVQSLLRYPEDLLGLLASLRPKWSSHV